ncbi:alpha-2-macroglobulin domain protein [Deinococcus aerius]|uniref:Alpha-2-macroglobulin domain protein n=1 Tax=Deinococcus aerius TaxID=200253 RepID=A0A2I9CXG7_9DEIO|nr:MG2 domain-containing protein [Deinococcus aerius]GBF06772.1 alpha-2-macroglobulin domain protein [Deinococcus aerius]
MKGTPARIGLLAALLTVTLAPAQPPVSLYGGVFRPGQNVSIGVNAPPRTELRLERVADPLAVFSRVPDPHQPDLPPGTRTTPVRTLRTGGKGYGEVKLGRLSPGLYVLRAGRAGTLILVSDLGLVVKRDRDTALVYAADRASGATRAARVWRLGTGGTSTLASPDGLAKFTAPAKEGEFFLARFGTQWAVSGANWNSYAAPGVKGFVYTDRPVYRPGQHVEFKGTLRSGQTLKPLANRAVRVTVFSPFDESVFQKSLTTNGYGSFSAGFDLPAGAKLGEYRFEARVSGVGGDREGVGGTFAVEAYQKPEYAVTVTPGRERAVQGDKLGVRVSARYLFGGSVGGARVTYNVTRAPYYPPGFDAEDYLPPGMDGQDYGSDLVVQGETRLNAAGNLDLTLPLERDENGQPLSYRIEAEVEDESRRPVSGFARVLAFPASVNVEARTDAYVYDAGKPIQVTLDTRDLAGAGRAAPVTLDLVRQEWVKVRGEYTLRETREARVTARTNAKGEGSATLTARRGGGYLLRATVRDEQGRTSTFENFAWVLKPGEDWGWNYRDLTLRPDKRSYAPGETATVLIGNPRPGAPVLVTIEGDRLRRSTVLRGRGSALTYSFRVTPDMGGDVFVGAAALGDGNFYSNAARVRVPVRGAELSVRVTPAKAKYRPGETGRLTVQVSDASGKGVPAELTLGVVDQSIYLIRPDTSTPMLNVFHAPRENVVGTDSSVSFYFETGRLPAPAPAMTEAAFGQGKTGDRPQEGTPREDFRDTILWVPNLVTDDTGRAELSVRFPDNLTTWVATARAQTVSARFGQTTAITMTTKDVIARLSLPPFLVRGDTATLAGVVNNTLPQTAKGQVTARVQGLTPVAPLGLFRAAGSPVTVSAGGRTRQDFNVRANTAGTARVTFGVQAGNANDSLRLPLPVKARGYDTSLTVAGAGGEAVPLRVPQDANLATARLRVFVTPSLLDAVTPALEYLVGYPYGCTEQTMSRFLPALLARQALGPDALPEGVRRDLPKIMDLSLARLSDFQHDDGGWGFWQFDGSTLEMTAYVTRGLLRARGLGVRVDNRVLDRALVYLARHVEDGKEPQGARATAYRALAEAGRVNAAKLAAFAGRAELAPYALAHTALALDRAGRKQAARDLLDRLKARRVEGGQGAPVHWEAPRRAGWFWSWEDNSVQTTAAALEALARLDPGSLLIPRASQWLLANRRGPRWVSTQDTTSVVVAALALKPAAGQPLPAQVSLNGQPAGTVTGAGEVNLTGANLSQLARGQNTLRVTGPRGASFSAELTLAREPRSLPGDPSRGFALTRTYERLVPTWNAKDKRYTYARTPLLRGGRLQPVTVGDLILVTLTVQPREKNARYLLVSDPIPAGMKALDDRSLAISGLNSVDEDDPFAWNYWYAGRDLLDDRVDLYADFLSGTGKMTYVLRAQTPGTFTALPTHAFLMYQPDVEGYAPAATLTVRDRGQ